MRLLLTAAAMLPLASCTTVSKIDTSAQTSLASICPQYAKADAAFAFAALLGLIPSDTAGKVAPYRDLLSGLCADPSQATTASALRKAADALEKLQAAQ